VVAEAEGGTRDWRGIDELAGLVGAYCWVENRIFELSGAWASDETGGLEPALRVWCAGASRRHGALAAHWAERLPVRAGVDRAALVVAPAGPLAGALGAMGATSDAGVGVGTLVQTALPRLRAVYAQHRRTASAVSEGPIVEVLTAALQDLCAEISSGRALLAGSPGGLLKDAALGPEVERELAETSVFPTVLPS